MHKKTETATFAAGCFWHVEEAFSKVKGVAGTMVGYTGGKMKNPDYRAVCSNETGHAEAVHIEFDPKQVSYEELLNIFWKIHDPTQLNRQGLDVGTQYRAAIFYHNEKKKKTEKDLMKKKQKKNNKKIVTQIAPVEEFYKAEGYHQKYFEKNKVANILNKLNPFH